VEEVQFLFTEAGGARERRAPVVELELSAPNIGSAFAADGSYIADFAWRPWEKKHEPYAFLFLC